MRPPGFALFALLYASPAISAELSPSVPTQPELALPSVEFRLGGAASRSVLPSSAVTDSLFETPRIRLSVPTLLRETSETVQKTSFGGLRLYFGEAWTENEDAIQLGTSLTRGQTTAGVSVTYEDDSEEVTRSELYLDYALNDQFSVGISGFVDERSTENSDPQAQLGVNAEFDTGNGTYLSGGFSDAAGIPPVFGVAIGLRF